MTFTPVQLNSPAKTSSARKGIFSIFGLGDVWARERKESHGWEPTRAPRLRLPMSVDDGTG